MEQPSIFTQILRQEYNRKVQSESVEQKLQIASLWNCAVEDLKARRFLEAFKKYHCLLKFLNNEPNHSYFNLTEKHHIALKTSFLYCASKNCVTSDYLEHLVQEINLYSNTKFCRYLEIMFYFNKGLFIQTRYCIEKLKQSTFSETLSAASYGNYDLFNEFIIPELNDGLLNITVELIRLCSYVWEKPDALICPGKENLDQFIKEIIRIVHLNNSTGSRKYKKTVNKLRITYFNLSNIDKLEFQTIVRENSDLLLSKTKQVQNISTNPEMTNQKDKLSACLEKKATKLVNGQFNKEVIQILLNSKEPVCAEGAPSVSATVIGSENKKKKKKNKKKRVRNHAEGGELAARLNNVMPEDNVNLKEASSQALNISQDMNNDEPGCSKEKPSISPNLSENENREELKEKNLQLPEENAVNLNVASSKAVISISTNTEEAEKVQLVDSETLNACHKINSDEPIGFNNEPSVSATITAPERTKKKRRRAKKHAQGSEVLSNGHSGVTSDNAVNWMEAFSQQVVTGSITKEDVKVPLVDCEVQTDKFEEENTKLIKTVLTEVTDIKSIITTVQNQAVSNNLNKIQMELNDETAKRVSLQQENIKLRQRLDHLEKSQKTQEKLCTSFKTQLTQCQQNLLLWRDKYFSVHKDRCEFMIKYLHEICPQLTACTFPSLEDCTKELMRLTYMQKQLITKEKETKKMVNNVMQIPVLPVDDTNIIFNNYKPLLSCYKTLKLRIAENGNPWLRSSPSTSRDSSASASALPNSGEIGITEIALYQYLSMHTLGATEDELQAALMSVHEKNGGSLSELSKEQILNQVQDAINELENCCSICFDPHTRGSTIELPCNHSFHKTCIKQWLKTSRCCPICRESVRVSHEFPILT